MLKSNVKEKYGRSEVRVTENEHPEQEAKLAMEMIVKWGCIACEPDGEDSSGRQKGKLMSEEMVVVRAFKTAKLTMEHARNNKLIHTCPDIPDEQDEEQ